MRRFSTRRVAPPREERMPYIFTKRNKRKKLLSSLERWKTLDQEGKIDLGFSPLLVRRALYFHEEEQEDHLGYYTLESLSRNDPATESSEPHTPFRHSGTTTFRASGRYYHSLGQIIKGPRRQEEMTLLNNPQRRRCRSLAASL